MSSHFFRKDLLRFRENFWLFCFNLKPWDGLRLLCALFGCKGHASNSYLKYNNQFSYLLIPVHVEFCVMINCMNPGRQGALGCLLNWSPKFYANVFLFFAQQLWGQYYILIGLNIKFSVETFQPLTYRMGNFVYQHWRCTSIYRPISYPFRSLV